MIAEALGSPAHAQGRPPAALLSLPGLLDPTVREVDEMRYEFTQPFIVDGTRARTRFGIEPTPLDEAIAYTVAWLRTADRQ
jgi:nucleoside-diphosphate-sugar epimerase